MTTLPRISKLTATIPHHAQLATSVYQFVTASGRRRMKQPYWLSSIQDDGPEGKPIRIWHFHFINEDTDIKVLKMQIEERIVWTQPQYIEYALEHFPDKFQTEDQPAGDA